MEEARRVAGRMSQLKAATRLAELTDPADRPAAMGALREVLETFTEGFDTLDLREARAVIDQTPTIAS